MGKVRNRKDTQDRSIAYRDARWNAKFGCAQDVDYVEYSIVNGDIVYVAVLELTLRETPKTMVNPPLSYFERVIERYSTESQGKFTKKTAKKLGVDAYIVVFNEDATRFWVYNLSKSYGFKNELNRKKYFEWLTQKHNEAINNYKKEYGLTPA